MAWSMGLLELSYKKLSVATRGINTSLCVSLSAKTRALGPLKRTIAMDPTPELVATAAIVSMHFSY